MNTRRGLGIGEGVARDLEDISIIRTDEHTSREVQVVVGWLGRPQAMSRPMWVGAHTVPSSLRRIKLSVLCDVLCRMYSSRYVLYTTLIREAGRIETRDRTRREDDRE